MVHGGARGLIPVYVLHWSTHPPVPIDTCFHDIAFNPGCKSTYVVTSAFISLEHGQQRSRRSTGHHSNIGCLECMCMYINALRASRHRALPTSRRIVERHCCLCYVCWLIHKTECPPCLFHWSFNFCLRCWVKCCCSYLIMLAQELLDSGNESFINEFVSASLGESLRPMFRLAHWHLQVFAPVFAPIVALFVFCWMNCQTFCISMMRHAQA